ncbi:recombinase family protein [Roseinatronobacter thiooxidans]|uniref:recombinase family protein n=1 Tax=Roseinatronobacter thiooxidans TaxID=121821 RepID=UPI002011ECFD|nr:recombinase family protein [Roseinatronobacter thiooxidans]
MPLIGYARVSTEDQTPLPQSQALKSAGLTEIHEEQAPDADRAWPVLAQLLEVIDRLEAKSAFFRSLQDPIDTASPQGKFTLQGLGAAAEFERALIRQRTKPGHASARTKARVGGNPSLRAIFAAIKGRIPTWRCKPAAAFWGSLETDLVAAVLALVADRIVEDGARLVINIEAFSIDDKVISAFTLSDSALVGNVHVLDDTNNANFQSFELSVAVEGLKAMNEDGTPILTAQMESEQAYEILIAAFAENVVDGLD